MPLPSVAGGTPRRMASAIRFLDQITGNLRQHAYETLGEPLPIRLSLRHASSSPVAGSDRHRHIVARRVEQNTHVRVARFSCACQHDRKWKLSVV